MKVRGILYIVFMVCLMAGCQDDFEEGFSGEGGMTEGMVTFRFGVENAAEIYTRSNAEAEEAIENVLLVVTDENDVITKRAYFESLTGGNSVRMYLSGDDATVYAFCNLPEEQTEYDDDGNPISVEGVKSELLDEDKTTTLQDLQAIVLTIETEDGANASSGFVMSGYYAPLKDASSNFSETYTIEVARLAAKLEFTINFLPENADDEFVVTGLYMFNIPTGSMLLPADDQTDDWNPSTKDYVNSTTITEPLYFESTAVQYSSHQDEEGKGYRIDYEQTGEKGYKATFYQFENRKGAVYNEGEKDATKPCKPWTETKDGWSVTDTYVQNGEEQSVKKDWSNLSSLVEQTEGLVDGGYYTDLYQEYRQINKRVLANCFDWVGDGYSYDPKPTETGFPNASYLAIKGVYTDETGASEVTYYVYLGSDNFADFNVKRNHHYYYKVRIYAADRYDTRVFAEPQGNLAIYYDNAILDAHFNVLQTLLYSQTNWTARVEDPDKTPWLEISTSPSYKPRKAGDTNPKSDVAQFSLSGGGGLNYIYVHTDEFIPKINSPRENPWYATTPDLGDGDRVNMGVKTRKGKIVIESATAEPVYINVEQYAAQMVILYIKHDVNNLMKEVRDTFYIEQVMEKKNMAWGFEKYWSLDLDQLISKGQWDGLKNTRELYHMALWGAESDVKAYYPDGIPSDIALGYALGKNRDRNGNGKIDAEEIVWYLPAANELQAIYGHTRPFDFNNEDDFYMEYENARSVYLPYEFGGPFHSSTPSASDAYGITSGFTYFVNMYNGEKSIGERSRYYNVICARRHNAWKGDNDGEVNGDIDVDDEWGDGNEVVVPR